MFYYYTTFYISNADFYIVKNSSILIACPIDKNKEQFVK